MRRFTAALLLLNKKKSGFTLIELMIGLAIVGILSAAILGFFQNQRRTYIWEDQRLERDQNLRTALNQIIQELKLAGFCASDGAFVDSLPQWVPSRFIPSYPSCVCFDGNPKVTLGDGDQPDMLTFACVLPTELNPTTAMTTTAGTELTTALNKTKTKEQYRVGDVLQVGYLPEYAVVKEIQGRTLTVDTDPFENGNQPLKRDYPGGTVVGEIYVVSYAVFNGKNDPMCKRHSENRPELKRKVNAGGFQPVADNIVDMRITTTGDGRIQVALKAKTEQPNYRRSNVDGILEVTGDVFIRNTRNALMATTCLKPTAPSSVSLLNGLDDDYPCLILMTWDRVERNEAGETLDDLGCSVMGYRIFYDTLAGAHGFFVDTDTEAGTGYVLDVAGLPSAGFYVSVAAKNSGGVGPRSSEKSIFDTSAPAAATNLNATVTASDQITIRWKDSPGCDIAGYYIYRKTAVKDYKAINANLVPQGSEKYVDSDLAAGVTYSYVMKAVDFAFNASGQSSAVTVVMP